MRTTLDIADDVLLAAKELAKREGKTAGEVLSELAREALRRASPSSKPSRGKRRKTFLGFEPFPPRGRIVTNEIVNHLRDEDPNG